MAAAAIQVGEKVTNLQVPGIFTVVARRGGLLELENAGGLRMVVSEAGVRRADGAAAVPRDESE